MSIQPFTPDQWKRVYQLGQQVDHDLEQTRVGLMMGGEPTYVSACDRDSPQWQYAALGDDKRRIAGQLLRRLEKRLADPGCLLHHGLGKLYPDEPVPRWALGCFWRLDGEPLWRNANLLAADDASAEHTWQTAKTFMIELAQCLAIPAEAVMSAFEPDATEPQGFVLPLLTVQSETGPVWQSCRWTPFKRGVTLSAGDSPIGCRLPLNELTLPESFIEEAIPAFSENPIRPQSETPLAADDSIRLALTVEVRGGTLHVFVPPMASARSYADVLMAIEATAEVLGQPIVLEGYAPPANQGIQGFQITPDPGVLEVNIHPAESWSDLVYLHKTLDDEAIACGLACYKTSPDGRVQGTGGGAHITIGGKTPDTSPLLRRPDLLRSFITYWQHHPSLSYLFAGQFIGPTSQSPRIDEARHDGLYELELAFLAIARHKPIPPAVLDRLLSPLLQDMTGNTHRTALCIDKLFPADNPKAQLGLLEFRGFEMPAQTGLRLLQMLLIRAMVAWFWRQPFTEPLRRWGAELRDRWLLPHYLMADFRQVLADLNAAGYLFETDWFLPFFEHRFPQCGKTSLLDNPSRQLELRVALEPWPVVGDLSAGGVSRPVDNSMERLQVMLTGAVGDVPESEALASRYAVLCNGYRVPIRSTGTAGSYVGGVRFRARSPLGDTHPALQPHLPLVFQVIDTWQSTWRGGAVYHGMLSEKGERRSPSNAWKTTSTSGTESVVPLSEGVVPDPIPPVVVHPETPMTLDLRLAVGGTK